MGDPRLVAGRGLPLDSDLLPFTVAVPAVRHRTWRRRRLVFVASRLYAHRLRLDRQRWLIQILTDRAEAAS